MRDKRPLMERLKVGKRPRETCDVCGRLCRDFLLMRSSTRVLWPLRPFLLCVRCARAVAKLVAAP